MQSVRVLLPATGVMSVSFRTSRAHIAVAGLIRGFPATNVRFVCGAEYRTQCTLYHCPSADKRRCVIGGVHGDKLLRRVREQCLLIQNYPSMILTGRIA